MVLFGRTARRAVAAGMGAAAAVGAMVFGAPGLALADPAAPAPPPADAAPPVAGVPSPADATPAPPNCTAADLAGVAAGVAAAASAYLFTHPDVNDYLTSLKGQPRSAIHDQEQSYMNAHPQTYADLQGIRQPLKDWQNRCQ
jgi:heme-binding protein